MKYAMPSCVLALLLIGCGGEPSQPQPTSDQAADTVKIGILHSLSGTMAISETSLRDIVLMAAEEINAKGGVLGKQIEPVVVDPASDWPLFAEKAKELINQHQVAVTFGCWTSVSRKSCLPVFEEYVKKDASGTYEFLGDGDAYMLMANYAFTETFNTTLRYAHVDADWAEIDEFTISPRFVISDSVSVITEYRHRDYDAGGADEDLLAARVLYTF